MSLKIIILSFAFLIISSSPVLAKKKISRSPVKKASVHPYGVWVKPKLRSDHHAILIIFGGMNYADKLDYHLTYSTDSVDQGVQGFHDPALGNTQTELIFGTCSGSDCTYHQGIENMILEIIIALKDGRTLTQRYQITP